MGTIGKKIEVGITARNGIGPFDILKSLFSSKNVSELYTSEMFKQSFFIINRTIAIKYPMQANAFNLLKVNPIDTIKFWNTYLYNGSGPQSWIYTRGTKKASEEKASTDSVSNSTIHEYSRIFHIKECDIRTAMSFYPEETIIELKKFENSLKE